MRERPLHAGFGLLTLFPGRVGGAETYVRGLLGAFAAGYGPERVTVLANARVAAAYGDLADGSVLLRQVRSYRAGDGASTRALAMIAARLAPRRTARDVPADIDVLHYAVTVPIPAFEGPTVVTLHDVGHHDLPQTFSRVERAYRRWAYDGAARSADLVVTGSEYSRGRLIERLGLEPERVVAVHHGIDHSLFLPRPAAQDRDSLAGYDLPARFVLYPANFWPHKNHLALVEALSAVADEELGLVLTGQAYGRLATVVDLARRLGVVRRVRHLGHVAPETLAALYRQAQAVVFPSLHEGFGQPCLEAMACGCPVAASAQGAVAEACGEAALGFDPGDTGAIGTAIEQITGEEELRQRLRAAGFDRAASFTWERSAKLHLEAYARVVQP